MEDLLDFARELARETGGLIVEEQRQAEMTREFKRGTELVTEADLKADRLICERIRGKFPGHRILSEESSPDLANVHLSPEPVWIVDPIDGTVNFAHGHRQSAVSIALASGGHIELGAVYNPFTDEMFSALRGQGAQLNGETIKVSGESELSRALIATGFPYEKTGLAPLIRRLDDVLHNCADIRRLGSAALDICWLACGRLDGFYETLSLWDFAAAGLIAREAGATYGHFSELPPGAHPEFHNENILIATPELFEPLQKLLFESSKSGIPSRPSSKP